MLTLAPQRRAARLALPLILLSACSAADPAPTRSDPAFRGVTVAGVTTPVAARAVRIGVGGRRVAACGALVTPTQASIAVHWTNSASSPVKTQASGEVYPCEIDGAWTGVVFPAQRQSTDACDVARAVNSPREYQGPCRWGWVESAGLRAPAG